MVGEYRTTQFKEVLQRSGKTLDDVVEATNISKDEAVNLLYGRKPVPTEWEIGKIADYLDVHREEIVTHKSYTTGFQRRIRRTDERIIH